MRLGVPLVGSAGFFVFRPVLPLVFLGAVVRRFTLSARSGVVAQTGTVVAQGALPRVEGRNHGVRTAEGKPPVGSGNVDYNAQGFVGRLAYLLDCQRDHERNSLGLAEGGQVSHTGLGDER